MPFYSIGQAARLLGVSPETVRRWADKGRLPTQRDGSGNRLIDGVALAAFVRGRAAEAETPGSEIVTSVRNSLTGIVTAVRADDVIAQVEIQASPHRVVSLVSREAVDDCSWRLGSRSRLA
ncbi:MerR family DNA-binding transcriptional regulator [Streptomyces sp. 5.8]|uniref:MerR family DNA-binding transcriptional regulator n=1 Tax=Streptomyces sp. 5.8 TaxID=3406571 RepID=UPI003BB66860